MKNFSFCCCRGSRATDRRELILTMCLFPNKKVVLGIPDVGNTWFAAYTKTVSLRWGGEVCVENCHFPGRNHVFCPRITLGREMPSCLESELLPRVFGFGGSRLFGSPGTPRTRFGIHKPSLLHPEHGRIVFVGHSWSYVW